MASIATQRSSGCTAQVHLSKWIQYKTKIKRRVTVRAMKKCQYLHQSGEERNRTELLPLHIHYCYYHVYYYYDEYDDDV